MEELLLYNLSQTQIVETDFTALALKAAAEIGHPLTEGQAVELAYLLAGETAAVGTIAGHYCSQLVYDLENEHAVHTWARWAADLDNDQTPPIQRYTEYVVKRLNLARITLDGQEYLADEGTREGLDAFFSKSTDRLKSYLTSEQFYHFVQGRIHEGRMHPVAPEAAS